jgi:D-amino-acid dehydrogenase
VIDRHPDYPQIGMVFGHHHLGVTQAAVSAKMISAMMYDDVCSPVLRPFGASLANYSVRRFT